MPPPSSACSDIQIFKMQCMRSPSLVCSDMWLPECGSRARLLRSALTSTYSRCRSCARPLPSVLKSKYSRCKFRSSTSSACSDMQPFKMPLTRAHLPRSVLTSTYSRCGSCAHPPPSVLTSKYSSCNSGAQLLRSVRTCKYSRCSSCAHLLRSVLKSKYSRCNSDAQLLRSVLTSRCSNMQLMRSPSSVCSDIHNAQDASHELTFFGPSWHSSTQDAIHGHTLCWPSSQLFVGFGSIDRQTCRIVLICASMLRFSVACSFRKGGTLLDNVKT